MSRDLMRAAPAIQPAGLWMAVTCPTCSQPVTVTNHGCTNGTETKAVVRCDNGHGDFLVTARIDHLAHAGRGQQRPTRTT